MIIIKLYGGLGNQMFQYATGRRLSIKNNTELKIDNTDFQPNNYRAYGLNFFNIKENIASQKEINKINNNWQKLLNKFRPANKQTIIKNFNYNYNKNILGLRNNKYLDGHWQSEKYFLDIKNIILKDFTLKNPLSSKAQEIKKQIAEKKSISIHVRRGDYINSPKFSKIYHSIDLKYYNQAIKKISKQLENPAFFIFSDNSEWAKKNLSLTYPTIHVSQMQLPAHEELLLMSKCQHNIIANSSFSWWGAWLNQNQNKIVIGPKKWFKFCDDDRGIMPKNWIKL